MSSKGVQTLPVLWELTLQTFQVTGLRRDEVTTTEILERGVYRQYILYGLTGLDLVFLSVIGFLIRSLLHADTFPHTAAMDFTSKLLNLSPFVLAGGAFIWFFSAVLFRVSVQSQKRAEEELAKSRAAVEK